VWWRSCCASCALRCRPRSAGSRSHLNPALALTPTLTLTLTRLAIATDGQRPVLKAASAEMQPDAISLAEVREEMRRLGGRLGAEAALETEGRPSGAAAASAAGAAAGWVVVEAEVRKRRRVLASGGANVSLCVLELQDGIVKARGRDGTSEAAAPLLALGHPALHSADKPDRRRLEALKHLGAAGARVRLAGRWVDAAAGEGRLLLLRAWRLERCCSLPKVVRMALGYAAEGVLAEAEARHALRYTEGGSYRAALLAESSAERRWRVAQTSELLQAEAPAPQLGSIELTPEQRAALEAHAGCRAQYRLGGEGAVSSPPRRASPRPVLPPTRTASTSTGSTPTGAPTATTGSARGSAYGSFLDSKKRPQLQFMAAQIRAVLQAHPMWGERPLHVVDIGGGKGLLAEHLAREMGDAVQVSLVELQPELVAAAALRARRAKQRLPNLQVRDRVRDGVRVRVRVRARVRVTQLTVRVKQLTAPRGRRGRAACLRCAAIGGPLHGASRVRRPERSDTRVRGVVWRGLLRVHVLLHEQQTDRAASDQGGRDTGRSSCP